MQPTVAKPGWGCSGTGFMRYLSDGLYIVLLVAAIFLTILNLRDTFGPAPSSENTAPTASSTSLRAEQKPLVAVPEPAPSTTAAATAPEPAAAPGPYDFDKPCAPEELEIIQTQLPGFECVEHKDRPYFYAGRCSFSYATRCPDPRWLHDFYRESSTTSGGGERRRRQAIYVGSEQAVDAVNTLKMLTLNEMYDRRKWQNARHEDQPEFAPGCKVTSESEFHIPPGASTSEATVYCLEPSKELTERLVQTREALHYEAGLNVVNAFISSEAAEGLDVPRQTLDAFVKSHVDTSIPIDILSLNMDGHDPEILKGADETLSHVLYLDFGYNWRGAWPYQSFSELINRLKGKGFVCFWSGAEGNLWRITDCFLPHYDHHFWAHVVCVKKSHQGLLQKMEQYYKKTLEAKSLIRYYADHTAATNGRGG